jgi:hypothetical protein
MTPHEDASQPPAGGTQRSDSDVDARHTLWILRTGCVLFIVGIAIVLVAPGSTATWSWWRVGFLLIVLGMFVLTAILGALGLVGRQWGFATRRITKGRFNRPELAPLFLLWCGIWMPCFLLAAVVFTNVAALWVFTVAVLILGFPLLVIELRAERNT